MNANFKKPSTSQTVPPAFYTRSQSTNTSFSAIMSTNSSTLIESYDPIGFFGPPSPQTLSSTQPHTQQQKYHSEPPFTHLFSEQFPRQCFAPPQINHVLPTQQTMHQHQQQYFQTFNHFNNYQSHATGPTLFADHFASTPTSSCYSPVTHISSSPIESNYLTEMNASPTSNSFEEKLDEMTNKLNNLISECNFYNPSNKSVVDSNRNTPDNAYASSSLLSDWSDTPNRIGSKIWSPQSSNNNSYENEANRSYLSSPRPIRAIKKSTNINVINVKDEVVDGKKDEILVKPQPQEEDPVFKIKTPRRNTERKNTYNSDGSPPVSSSLSRMQSVKKNLPLRSLGVDMSAFLNKKDSSQDRSSSSDMLNHQGKMKTSSKVNCNNKRDTGCSFCVNNGESVEIYMSHTLKDALGKVVCPILRVHVCKLCGESGDFAHTIKYCPETQRREKLEKIKKCTGQI